MATKTYYFSGLIKWAKRQKDDRYNNYTINLYPDDKTFQAIKDTGVQIKPKEDEDGKFFTFRRPEEKAIKGDMVHFGAPGFFIDKNGTAETYEGIIGNGSKGTVKILVFDVPATGGKGHRYESVLVKELVEYTPPDSADEAVAAVPGAVAAAGAPKKITHVPSVPF
jgi:hypothetical protein